MPVTTQVGRFVRNDHKMECARRDSQLAARAEVFLLCLIGLDQIDGYVEKIAHAITANVASTAMTTTAMSRADFSWVRKGLNPTPKR
jgi:hypothetical protein